METAQEPAVLAQGLRRTFGDTVAVDGVDLTIELGGIFGLLGPDGAGKSTLIRMLATTLRPDAGDATVFGRSVTADASDVRPRIGYMSQRFSMYPDLTVAENMDFFATIRGVSPSDRAKRAPRLLEAMGMSRFADRESSHLSGGMKQKLMLATTLMHEPDLLLLDEPTTGVDPVSRREFWRILADLHRQGKTVLVATPYMDEAERCTSIAFLESGQIRQSGTPSDIKARIPGRVLEIHTDADSRVAIRALSGVPGVSSADPFGDTVRVLWTSDADPVQALTDVLSTAGLSGVSVRVIAPDMETVFAYLAEASAA